MQILKRSEEAERRRLSETTESLTMPQLPSHDASQAQVWAYANHFFTTRSQVECSEKSKPRVCRTCKTCCRDWCKRTKCSSIWVRTWLQLCLLLEEWAQQPCTEHIVRHSLNGTCRVRTTNPPGKSDLTPSARSRSVSGTRLGIAGVVQWVEFQSAASRVLQAADSCLWIKGLSTCQVHSSLRINGSCGETLRLSKPEGPTKLSHSVPNGSSLGTIQRVLELDTGMHDVFVGVEHRLRV